MKKKIITQQICIEVIVIEKIKKHLIYKKDNVIFQDPNFLFIFYFFWCSLLYRSVHLKHIFGEKDEDEQWREEIAGWQDFL